jgi:3-methyladenine DNA glycosylase AlkD
VGKRTAEEVTELVLAAGSPQEAEGKARFFRAGPGGYAEGDRFAGVRVPALRRMARAARGRTEPADIRELLRSPWHEVRLLGALLLVELYREYPAEVVGVVLADAGRFDNWDLVDSVAPYTLGPWLVEHRAERGVLDRLIASPSLWERRIALVATFALIRAGEFDDLLRLAERVLDDPEDLIHKAAGWMLREVGLRDRAALDGFLDRHAAVMPRVMLRYAIEKHTPEERRAYRAARP